MHKKKGIISIALFLLNEIVEGKVEENTMSIMRNQESEIRCIIIPPDGKFGDSVTNIFSLDYLLL